ncbi:UNVERIFIED_CONTAM: hypothetical protein HDU68_001477 [Siphonaria sp. JEL0065]|nr:hypothetical protein HDU68_001477 [Siphonaria sp. JEL0065]
MAPALVIAQTAAVSDVATLKSALKFAPSTATFDNSAAIAAATIQVKAQVESMICDVCTHSSVPHMKHPELL